MSTMGDLADITRRLAEGDTLTAGERQTVRSYLDGLDRMDGRLPVSPVLAVVIESTAASLAVLFDASAALSKMDMLGEQRTA